jgi:hypothetical protein
MAMIGSATVTFVFGDASMLSSIETSEIFDGRKLTEAGSLGVSMSV